MIVEKTSRILHLCVDDIRTNPYQPRQKMDKEALLELAASIKKYGLMQPVVVRQINNCDYELVAGERRLAACKLAQISEIPAVVVRVGGTDSAVMALVENIQRENLGYIEEARAFCSLISEHGLTQEELAEKVGKSQSAIANKIRILKLSPAIQEQLMKYDLSERHARALLKLPDEKLRLRALEIVTSKGLNVTKTEELVDSILTCKPEKTAEKTEYLSGIRDIRIFSNTIRQAVDMMKRSGIAAHAEKVENDEFIEYTIKIPKDLKKVV